MTDPIFSDADPLDGATVTSSSSDTVDVTEPRGRRPVPLKPHFARLVRVFDNGRLDREASASLDQVVEAVRQTGKKGTVIITVSLEPLTNEGIPMTVDNRTAMTLDAKVAVRIPRRDLGGEVVYPGDLGGVTHVAPGQFSLDARTGEVVDPQDEEEKIRTAERILREQDEQPRLLRAAAGHVVVTQLASVTMLTRKLRVPSAKADELLRELERLGVVTGPSEHGMRSVLIPSDVEPEELDRLLGL